ncbi:MAG: hypothetical protein ACRDSH_16715, partial [Pseudonocardiaceae bacterium]
FGRGLIEDVGGKIIGQFADCLSRSLGEEPAPVAVSPASAGQPVPVEAPAAPLPPPPVRPVPPPVTEEIDLLDAAGGAVAKRALPVAVALVLLAVVIRWRRSGRRRR